MYLYIFICIIYILLLLFVILIIGLASSIKARSTVFVLAGPRVSKSVSTFKGLQAGRPEKVFFFRRAFVARILTRRSRNPAMMGFFWGVDQD